MAAQVAYQASTSARTQVPTTKEWHTSSSSITQDELKTLIAKGIKEFQASINLPIHGCRKPYPAHYDTIPFPTGYQKPNFEKFDGLTGSPQEHLWRICLVRCFVDKKIHPISQRFCVYLVDLITTRVNPYVGRFTKGFSCPICEFKEESFNH